ncbi:MAG TPA: hypothetical protein VGQ57_15900 [Polyangiaceae bacterium]|nr:hypothetical protein [Polyangiaceae bacterium]
MTRVSLFPSLAPRLALAILAAAVLVSCDSDSDTVCTDAGNCSHGGSDSWITECRAQNDELDDEADAVGCSSEFDAYWSCAEDKFVCHGNQTSFPGCEAKAAAYSACLSTRASGTACAELTQKLTLCGASGAEAGAGSSSADSDPASGIPDVTPCTASGNCSSRCYLDHVPDLCAPRPADLAAFADCAEHCIF